MSKPFIATDWYWTHANGRVFGSARTALVSSPQSDAAFSAWKDAGGVPTPWPRNEAGEQSDDALRAVLAPYGLHLTRKDALSAAVNAKRDAVIAAGYRHNFGGSAGIRTLDQRSPADAINWLGQKGIADALIADGKGSQPMPFIAADNSTFSVSATVASAALLAMGLWQSSITLHARQLKDAIAARDPDAIDIEAGWPTA